jgi:hypothetical protein
MDMVKGKSVWVMRHVRKWAYERLATMTTRIYRFPLILRCDILATCIMDDPFIMSLTHLLYK